MKNSMVMEELKAIKEGFVGEIKEIIDKAKEGGKSKSRVRKPQTEEAERNKQRIRWIIVNCLYLHCYL